MDTEAVPSAVAALKLQIFCRTFTLVEMNDAQKRRVGSQTVLGDIAYLLLYVREGAKLPESGFWKVQSIAPLQSEHAIVALGMRAALAQIHLTSPLSLPTTTIPQSPQSPMLAASGQARVRTVLAALQGTSATEQVEGHGWMGGFTLCTVAQRLTRWSLTPSTAMLWSGMHLTTISVPIAGSPLRQPVTERICLRQTLHKAAAGLSAWEVLQGL